MPMGVVAEVVTNGGTLPQLEQLEKLNFKKPFFSKKNGVVFGTFWFIFLTMFCTAFFGILGAPEELIAIIAISGVFGAMMIIIGSLVLLPSSRPPVVMPSSMQPFLGAAGSHQALPPQQSVPASVYGAPQAGSWRDTNDLQPTSVTENTTRLLEEKDRR